jgi:hypothetical protein
MGSTLTKRLTQTLITLILSRYSIVLIVLIFTLHLISNFDWFVPQKSHMTGKFFVGELLSSELVEAVMCTELNAPHHSVGLDSLLEKKCAILSRLKILTRDLNAIGNNRRLQ